MLILYTLPGCPFCAKVLQTGEELGIEFDERSIDDEAIAEELETRGGKIQTPYLVDEERGKEMYESDDIIAYLHEHFGKAEVE